MASVFPFRALRPVPDAAAQVAAVPYDVVSREEAATLAAGNPLSFLHVSRAEIDLPPSADPYAPVVYETAVRAFEALKREAPLVIEDEASVYFYRLRMGEHEQTGVAACYDLDEYDSGAIRKHERTRPDKEDDRTRHLLALRAQTGPVFLTYRASALVDAIARGAMAAPPLFDFEAGDRVRHTVWRAGAGVARALVDAFAAVPALYIADGHHRAASAARARAVLHQQGATRPAGCDTLLAVAFPHDQVHVLPYHRIVKDLAGRTPAALLADVGARFPLRPGPATPARKGEVAMYLGGAWHVVDVRSAAEQAADRIGTLDVSILQEQLLAPILHIGDPRTDKRVEFVGGARGTGHLEQLVNSGSHAVAFSMYPVTVEDLMAISDAGGIMPPKSTWFEPKLRDGLLSHLI